MGYITSVKVVDSAGRPTKAEIICGGKSRGYTDDKTGDLNFEMDSNQKYDVSASRHGNKVYGKVKGGQHILLRL